MVDFSPSEIWLAKSGPKMGQKWAKKQNANTRLAFTYGVSPVLWVMRLLTVGVDQSVSLALSSLSDSIFE